MVVIPIIMIIMMIIRIITFSIIAKGVTTVSTQSTGTGTKIVQNVRFPVHQRDHGGNEVTCNVYFTYFGSNLDGLAMQGGTKR